ncbi:MAG TPA: MFS transporter [Bacillales bacterium]|nr:MFS transporter [Bacillales bacterium]
MVFRVLRTSHFRYFFLSEIISGFGVGMSTVGANWFLLDETDSSKLIGIMLSVNVISGFLISPFIGILTDKFNRKAMILWAYLVQAAVLIGITSLFLWAGFHIWYLFLFAMVNGMGWTIYMSTSRSLVQELLPEKDLINGNSLTEISLQVGMFMAGAASGILYKFFGFPFILIVNSAAFMTSSIFLSRIRYTSMPIRDKEESYILSFKNGIKYLMDRPKVFFLGVAAIIPLVTTMIYNVVLPEYVEDAVNGGSIVFGLTDMAYGIGGLLSGFIAAAIAKKLSNNITVALFFLVAVSILFVFSLNQYVWFLYLGSLLFGLCNSSLRILMNTTIMKKVSTSFMGRAMSVWMAISLLMQTLFSSGIGLVVDRYYTGIGFVCLGAFMLLGLILHSFICLTTAVDKKTGNFERQDKETG